MPPPHLVLHMSVLEAARAAERGIGISREDSKLDQMKDEFECSACDNFIAGVGNCWQICKEN